MAAARVLVVCTGNVCRSPLAERVLRARLAAAGVGEDAVVVSSAGTHALVGGAMTPEAVAETERAGADAAGAGPRQLTEQLVKDADLVLTATLAHRSAVVALHPRALRRSFGLIEIARLLEGADRSGLPDDPADRVRALAALAAGRRGAVALAAPGADDVRDPYGQPAPVYARTTAQVLPAVDVLVDVLTRSQDGR